MADECDFDTLAAMLDSDEEVGDGEAHDKKSGAGPTDDAGMSSDDDIDDDELDRLAGLVEKEEEESAETEAAAVQDEADMDQLLAELGDSDDSEDEGGKESKNPEAKLTTAGDTGTKDDASDDAEMQDAEEEEEKEEDEEDGVEAQLRKMREQIKLLEAQVKKKKTPQKKFQDKTPVSEKIRKKSTESKSSEHAAVKKEKSFMVAKDGQKSNGQTMSMKKTSATEQITQPSSRNVFESVTVKKERVSPKSTTKDSARSTSAASKDIPHSQTKNKSREPSGGSQKKKASSELLDDDIFGSEYKASNGSHPAEVVKSKKPAHVMPSAGFHEGKHMKSPNIGQPKSQPGLGDPRPGGDSDSDWEDLDGEKSGDLSKHGQEIKGLMKKSAVPGQRVAHEPKFEMSMIQNRKPTWGSNAVKHPSTSSSSQGSAVPTTSTQYKPAPSNDDIDREHFSGLRIVKPLIPSTTMRSRMENRKMIRMSNLHKRTNTADMDSDWVTMGVIVSKSEPKMSSKGNQFSIWTMSDLDDCEKEVKLFLFGEVHKEKWKTSVGRVVGLLNASVMKNSEKYQNRQNETCLTLDHPMKIMDMGVSRDFGICKATTKAGRSCHQFINKSKGEYCTFHVQAMYKRVSAKRGDLQSSHTGVVPRTFEKALATKKEGTVFYGGQSFATGKSVPTQQKKGVSLKGLQQHQKVGAGGKAKITTLALHDLLPDDKQCLNDIRLKKEAEKHEAFHDLLTTPSVGSMNLVKHLVKKETGGGTKSPSSEKTVTVKSVTASDLIKQMRSEHSARRSSAPSSTSGLKSPHVSTPIPSSRVQSRLSGGPNVDVIFDFDSSLSMKPLMPRVDPAFAKKKAIEKIRNKGGIKKEDPNAVRKDCSTEQQEKIKKRVAEQLSSDSAEEDKGSKSRSSDDAPPKKKSRHLGSLDLEDPEVQKLLSARSKYEGRLTEAEQERFDEYFDVGEKKENMEQKMASTSQMKVKAVSCKQCKYTYFKPLPSCKDQQHTLTWHDAVKRFFKCTGCKRRCFSFDRYPNKPCDGCGGTKYEKSVMREERKGPALPGEELLTRGEELKNLNSLAS